MNCYSIQRLVTLILFASYFLAKWLAKSNQCINFNITNKHNHEIRKNRWAIVALTKPNSNDANQRNARLLSIIKPYSNLHDITIIFFSEKSFPKSILVDWTVFFQGHAKVEYINTADKGFNLKPGEKFGYKYMCKFFSLDMYDYLRDFDYYMRCDTDCFITKLSYDVFHWAVSKNVQYGFAIRKLEAHRATVDTLPIWTVKYLENCRIQPKSLMDQPVTTCFNFYNNFHIGKVSFFLRTDVKHFLESVNSSGNILENRWGDSSIQAYAVRIFMEPEHIKQLPDFVYIHGSHGNKVVSTVGDGSSTNVPQRLPNWKHDAI